MMKISPKLETTIPFRDLEWGDCFRSKVRNNAIFIKIPFTECGDYNAVILETGLLACFPSNEQVEPLPNAKVVI